MRALQILEPGRFEVRDVPVPEPGEGEILLKILAVTTCPHWDIHILEGQPMFLGGTLDYPYTLGQPGHEACGEIAALGEGVTGLEVGQRVCAWRDRGHDVQGCYAQYAVMGPEDVIPVPPTLPPEACAALELAMCMSAHIMYAEKLGAIAGKRVGVFGLGPAGLAAVQLAKAAGAAEVIGFETLSDRCTLAAELGADHVFNTAHDDLSDFPRRGEAGALDCTFDCVGIPAVVHHAMELTNQLVVLFAVQRAPYVFPPKCWSGLTLAGARPHTRAAAEYAAARLAEGAIDLGKMVTHTMPLAHYGEAVELLKRREALKVAFLPQEG